MLQLVFKRLGKPGCDPNKKNIPRKIMLVLSALIGCKILSSQSEHLK